MDRRELCKDAWGKNKSGIYVAMNGEISCRNTAPSLAHCLSVCLSLFDVLILVNVEKPSSHKYVDENGNNTLTAISEIAGYSLLIDNQNVSKGISKNCNFNVLSAFKSASSSCKPKIFGRCFESIMNGSRTQSKSSTLSKIFFEILLQEY